MGHPQPLWAAVPAPHHSHSKELPPETEVADRHKAVIQRLSLIRLKHFFSCLLAEVLLKGKRKSVHRESEDLKDPPKKKQKISGNIK